MHMRQHVQNANAFEANAHKEKASMSDTQSFGLYETTCANAFEESTNKENASMYDTQSLDVYDMCKCTYAMKTHKKMQVCATPNL